MTRSYVISHSHCHCYHRNLQMKRSIIIELGVLLIIFTAIWAVLVYVPIFPEKINFDIDIPIEKEEKLGDLLAKIILSSDNELNSSKVDSAIFIIQNRLIDAVGVTDYDYKIRVIDNPAVNAFAIPGGNIFIFSGLIEFIETPEELAAILAHEIGHVENRHVVKKLAKELGLNILFTIITGNDNIILKEISKTATSTIFDRKQEREADKYAMELLVNSNINPKVIASFFLKISREKGSIDEKLEFLMTHPHNNSRIKASLEYKIPDDFEEKSIGIEWEKVKEAVKRVDN